MTHMERLREGSLLDGDCGSNPLEQPKWMDIERFRRGQEFFHRHVEAISFALHCSLTLGFAIINLLDPLVHTQRSDTPPKSRRRYLETWAHLYLWHRDNVWDPTTDGYRSVQAVRRMHSTVKRSMAARSACACDDGNTYAIKQKNDPQNWPNYDDHDVDCSATNIDKRCEEDKDDNKTAQNQNHDCDSEMRKRNLEDSPPTEKKVSMMKNNPQNKQDDLHDHRVKNKNSVNHSSKGTESLWKRFHVSQYDMALVQAGFMAVVVMYPESFGILCTRNEVEDYAFFWRGIGYLLGIDDAHNVCSGTFDETYAICKEIEVSIMLEGLRNPPEKFAVMADAYIDGINRLARFRAHTKEAVIAFSMDVMGHEWEGRVRLTYADCARLASMKLMVWMRRWCPGFERLLNYILVSLTKKWLAFVDKHLDYYAKKSE